MTIRSRHKKFSSQHWLLSICDGSCIIWRVDHSNVTTAGVTNYRNMWRISSTVTKGLDILWWPSIFRHAVLFVSFVLWRQRDDHFFVTNFFLWQYLPLTWRLRFVIQSQNSCSACLGRRRATCIWLCLVSRARRAVVVGHARAMSCLTRHHLIKQGTSRR